MSDGLFRNRHIKITDGALVGLFERNLTRRGGLCCFESGDGDG